MHINIVDQLSGNIGWKDAQLHHLGCNNNLAIALKLKSPNEIIGLKDSDLSAHTEQDTCFHFQNDQLALAGKTVNVIHLHNESLFYLTKKPLVDSSKKIIGVIYHCQELENPDLLKLNKEDKKYCEKEFMPSFYSSKLHSNPFQFSKRELECVFYMLRGKTTKEIAKAVNLSKRTIDFYIVNIKNKIGCNRKSELILAAMGAGYMNFIPSNDHY